MRPMSPCKLRGEDFRRRLIHSWRQQLYCPLLDLGESLAERKGFKTWKASTDEKEVSLALRSEEVLIIAANDEELWRLGFYRRMAEPPYELPSEESVELWCARSGRRRNCDPRRHAGA